MRKDYKAFVEIKFEIDASAESDTDADLVFRSIIYEVYRDSFSRAQKVFISSMVIQEQR